MFLVTGSQSLRDQGTLQRVLSDLSSFSVNLYEGVPPFPSSDQIDQAVEVCRRKGSDLVVAVGGGSAIDLAKLVAVLMANPGPFRGVWQHEETDRAPWSAFYRRAHHLGEQQRGHISGRHMGHGPESFLRRSQPSDVPRCGSGRPGPGHVYAPSIGCRRRVWTPLPAPLSPTGRSSRSQ